MKNIGRIVLLFVLDWITVFVFYWTEVLLFVVVAFQKLLRTSTAPPESLIVCAILVVSVVYIINRKFIKSKIYIFAVSQVLFLVSLFVFLYNLFSGMRFFL